MGYPRETMRVPAEPSGTRHGAKAVVVIVAILGLASCGSGDSGDPAGKSVQPRSPAPRQSTVTITDFVFRPPALEVPAGTVVRVENRDDAVHTMTADDKSFDTGNIEEGAHASINVAGAGDVAYRCSIHNEMRGVIQVRA